MKERGNSSSMQKVENPKQYGSIYKHTQIYPYYAGFSRSFADAVIGSMGLRKTAHIMDPWNGSGTTTLAATRLGYKASGIDINPIMMIVAKGKMLSKGEAPSLIPIYSEIALKSMEFIDQAQADDDPLLMWFDNKSVRSIRKIEKALQSILVDPNEYKHLVIRPGYGGLSGLASFFYIALFRTIKRFLKPFRVTNPTWIRRPNKKGKRISVSLKNLLKVFMQEIEEMKVALAQSEDQTINDKLPYLVVASSENIPFDDQSVDFVLSSPPYCTRIDYAIATLPELAVFGYSASQIRELREKLIGTPTILTSRNESSIDWGSACNSFLDKVKNHASRASASYYYRNHCQYFHSAFGSIKEISRVLAAKSKCCLVVQDSFYKDIHNDLPKIYIEMARSHGLILASKTDFRTKTNMAGINPSIKKYRDKFNAYESVLLFCKK